MSNGGPLFVTDEGFNRNILRGVLSRAPAIAIVRVQDVGLSGASDPDILEWAAQEGRIVITHDKRTMRADAIARLIAGLPMPGVIGTTLEDEWENQIRFAQRR